ncbi:hypothetical protein HHK36_016463 [Tetracentron sinense]|uniref:CCHC-type domain-containing protein n=1 Tax=Tetracentron sinense TaxID=13715 RepID=A0A834Z1D6_TETSI|nr:hypothetical protein HHK36_016463 [Tetracentron sinense]
MVSERQTSNECLSFPVSCDMAAISASTTDSPIITINAATTINEKLTPSTFFQWRAQFEALLVGYDLIDFVTGVKKCPVIDATNSAASKAANSHWIRQDKLILHAVLASTSTTITPLLAAYKTSHEAWTALTRLYAGKSRTRVMQLKEDLTLSTRGNRTVTEFLQAIKVMRVTFDVWRINRQQHLFPLLITLIGKEVPLDNINPSTRLATTMGTTKMGPSNSGHKKYKPKCQWCDQVGHTAKNCPKMSSVEFTANCAASSQGKNHKWLVDSAASHNMTTDLSNLSINSEYDGTDEVVIGDGSAAEDSSITISLPQVILAPLGTTESPELGAEVSPSSANGSSPEPPPLQSIDELKHRLLYTTFELESARMEAKEEMRKNEESVKQLLQLLKMAYQERDDARDQLQALLNKVIPSSPTEICTVHPHLQPESPPLKPTKANSSLTESDSLSETYNQHSYGSSPVNSFFDATSSPELLNMNMPDSNNTGIPQQPFVQEYNGAISMGIISSGSRPNSMGIISSGTTMTDHASAVSDKLAKGRPLPQKGRLLQAVIEAGPLLQTLLVAGPLPQWRNPPPLQPLLIPPVSIKGCDPETTNQKPVANPNYAVLNSLGTSYHEISHGSAQTYSTSMLDFTSGADSCLNNGRLLSSCIGVDLMHQQLLTGKRQRFQ